MGCTAIRIILSWLSSDNNLRLYGYIFLRKALKIQLLFVWTLVTIRNTKVSDKKSQGEKIVEASNIVESKLLGADRNDGDNDDNDGSGDDYGARMLAGMTEEEATGIEGR